MSAIEKVLAANRDYSLEHDPSLLSPRPTMKLAVLTCMDTRLGLKSLGLRPQDAHLIRNAGGIVTDDTLRSLLISHYVLGTEEIMVINHTDCGLMKATEEQLHEMVEAKAGGPANVPVKFHAFTDVEENVREQLRRLESHSWIHDELKIRGFVYDVNTGKLLEVKL